MASRKSVQMGEWAWSQFRTMAEDIGIPMSELFDQLAARMLSEERRKATVRQYSRLPPPYKVK